MKNIGEIITSLLEILNINYHLQKQDEKDRESIALMGLTQNTNTIDYQKNSEIPPISLDKNCLSWSGRVTVILKAFKAACLSYSPSSVAYKGHTLTRLNLLDWINLSISELKDRLCDKNILKSELPQPLLSLNESNELDKISKLNKINGDVPWPKIEGNLPINNPKSISPRTNTERSITDSFLPITKRTKDTYSNVIKREIKKRRLNETDIKLPNLREKLNNSSGKNKLTITIYIGKVKINSALSSSSRKHSVVNQFTIRENYKDKPPETIILRIPELDDSPEFEDVDLLTAKRRVAKLGSNNSMRRSQSAKGSRNHETEKKLMDAP